MLSRISFLLIATAMSWVSCQKDPNQSSSKKPNIVLVVSDDQGYHDFSWHDSSRIKTPTLERLSADGIRLENYYVQPVCSPSRYQLMTGRLNIHDGSQHSVLMSGMPTGLALNSPTMADKLHEVGYATHVVGKWHLGFCRQEYLPQSRGFDHHFGFLDGGNDHLNHSHEYFFVYGHYLDLRRDDKIVTDKTGIHSNYLYPQEAIDIIQAHNKDQPLFLYLALQAPHVPLQAPDSYVNQYNDVEDENRRIYGGLVTMMDEAINNVTIALKDTGMWDDTIFVFSSDNGADIAKLGEDGGNNYPLRGGKTSLWEGGIKVPAFVTGGKNIEIARGYTSNDLFHISDWFPTLLNQAGASVSTTDGFDQWAVISQGKSSKRDYILHNIDSLQEKKGKPLYNDTFDTTTRAAIRVGDYKLLTGDVGVDFWMAPPERQDLEDVYSTDPVDKNVWLFNIKSDPHERNDLSQTNKEKVRELLARLSEFKNTAVDPIYPAGDANANPALHNNVWSPWL